MQGFCVILPDFFAPSQLSIRLKALIAKGFDLVQQALFENEKIERSLESVRKAYGSVLS
jgi:hypothetical protein